MKRDATIAGLALVALATAVGAVLVSRGDATTVERSKVTPHAVAAGVAPAVSGGTSSMQLRGGTRSQLDLLSQILGGVDCNLFLDARIGTPPAGFEAAPRFGELGSAWLYLTLKADGTEAGLLQPDWEASIVAGAFRDLAHAASLPDVLGYSVQLVFPNGLASALDSTAIAEPFSHRVTQQDADALANARGRLASLEHVRGSSERVLHAAAPAIVETITTDDPQAFVSRYSSLQEVFGDLANYDATLVRVVDGNGKLVALSGFATRVGVGGGWIRPDVAPSRQTAGQTLLTPQGG